MLPLSWRTPITHILNHVKLSLSSFFACFPLFCVLFLLRVLFLINYIMSSNLLFFTSSMSNLPSIPTRVFSIWNIIILSSKSLNWGTWVTQSVECLSLGFGSDLILELWDQVLWWALLSNLFKYLSLSLSLCPCTPPPALCLPQINI